MEILDLTYSPLKGPKGNIEYLLYLKNSKQNKELFDKEFVKKIVSKSHESDSF